MENIFANTIDRLPPQNIEAEEAILGGILLDPSAISRVSNVLVADAFYIAAHRHIYYGLLQLERQGKPTDLLAITAWLGDNDLLTKIGGKNKLVALVVGTVSAVNIDALANLVIEKYQRRLLIKASNEISQLAYDASVEVAEVVSKAEEKVFNIVQQKDEQGLVHIRDTLTNSFIDIESRSQGLIEPAIASGLYDFDNVINGGFQRSDLIIVAGRPAMGKSAFAINIAKNIASTGYAVAVFSLEMSKEQLGLRLLAAESRIQSSFLKSGKISQAQWEDLTKGISALQDLSIYIDDTANITISEMRSKLRRLQAESPTGIGIVVVDYLQLMEGGGENRVQEISKITRGLKNLARELNVPIMALSQLNRGVESRTNKRPMLSDLKESGSIEQDADLVVMLYRDEYYNPDSPERAIAEAIVVKHRHGATGTTRLLFDAEFTQFKNLANAYKS
jgi:replicative DNA helicase